MTVFPKHETHSSAEGAPAGRQTISRRAGRLLGLLVLVAVLPLFVDLSQRTIPVVQLVTGFGSPDQAGSRLHVVIPFIAVLAVIALWRKGPSLWRLLPVMVILLLLQFTVAIGWGLLHGAGMVGIVFFIQTVVPLVAWLVMYRIATTPRTLAQAVMVGVLFVAVTALLYTLFNGGIGNAYFSSIELEDPFPQYRAYYPALVALGIALAVASIKTDRYLSIATLAGCLLLIPIMWSRAGICMVVVALLTSLFFCHFRGTSWRLRLLVAAGTGVTLAAVGLAAVTVGLTAQRTKLSDLASSDSDRVMLAQESSKRIVGNPLVGDAFRGQGTDLVGGGVATFDRLFPSHNQYLDFGIRGGLLALVLLVAFLFLTTWRLFRRWLADPPGEFEPVYGATLGFLLALIPAGLTELYISQTWTGVAIMLVLGAVARELEVERTAAAPGGDADVSPDGPGYSSVSVEN